MQSCESVANSSVSLDEPTHTMRAHRASLPATPLPSVLVFPNEAGGPIDFSNWTRRVWIARDRDGDEQGLRKKAGLPARATFHGLRHTAATLLLGSGVDVRTTAGVLGHAKPSMTLDVYADFIPSNAERAMAQLDALVLEAKNR